MKTRHWIFMATLLVLSGSVLSACGGLISPERPTELQGGTEAGNPPENQGGTEAGNPPANQGGTLAGNPPTGEQPGQPPHTGYQGEGCPDEQKDDEGNCVQAEQKSINSDGFNQGQALNPPAASSGVSSINMDEFNKAKGVQKETPLIQINKPAEPKNKRWGN